MKKNLPLALLLLLSMASPGLVAQSNQYLHFDKLDDYVEVPNGSGYIANAQQVTMAGWFYHDALAYGQGLMSIRGGGSGTGEMYLIQLNNGTLECRLITTAGFHEFVAPAFSIVPQVWQHFAWVYDGSTVKLYIDGQLKGTKAASGSILSTDKPFTIGKCLLGGFNFVFGGRADEVSLWSKALSQQEIQDMMADELAGDEPGLQLYYKFNQGVPGGDNTSISKLESETGSGDRDGNLLNFALNGSNSNFGGVLDIGFQAITFPQIPNKLVSDAPFQLNATASSGLPVSYQLLSGPASLNGDVVSLSGQAGTVSIMASQAGDATYDPAVDLLNTFQVIDPATLVPDIDPRSPLPGDVHVPVLRPIQLAAIASIQYPELFSVTGLKFSIGGTEIQAKDWGNGHYTAWWTPPAYGSYQMSIIAANNFGADAVKTIGFNVVGQATEQTVTAIDAVWADVNNGVVEVEAELPSFLGAFDQVTANLLIQCPPGGCDPWDRISGIEVKGHNGQWYEIFRYITPYGVPCGHVADVTDFMSALQGKIRFRVNLGTLGNGFLYTLILEYNPGEPENPYSTITEVWRDTYDFGNPSNLQPVPAKSVAIEGNAVAAKLKLVSTGHGWGDNNTGNAAEFHEDTHHVWINGSSTFEQHNWKDCNPNPDGCSPQNGTWFYDRAGWCPGAIAPWFDYDMTPYIGQGGLSMEYRFDEDYVDLCHPDNPGCVSGATCPNCDDGYNPHLIVSSYLVASGTSPLDGSGVVGAGEPGREQELSLLVFPNPGDGLFHVRFTQTTTAAKQFSVSNRLGQVIATGELPPGVTDAQVDLRHVPPGAYFLHLADAESRWQAKLLKLRY